MSSSNPIDPTPTTDAHAPDALDAGLAEAFAESATGVHGTTEVAQGTVISGKYTLMEVIGEGGMGSVWRAKQTEPVKRFVAVKLIKAGMDSRQVLARFEAERQALAMMDHPHISKVLDGGLHDGRPFFVMELVKGVPITEYCDQHKLTPRQRLELFVQACQAIQHAHQKGIIHRDIKPSNVLIAPYDDRPVVKVIDFGVAKATGATLTEKSIDTAFGGVVGTPQYMSPEQATLNNLDIDTRSDVYALGVLLYEMLTGSPPFARKDLEQKGLLEMLRVVREEEPPRPSTRLSTADALPTLSANRGTEPRKLTGLLRNELDWIVMKALEKNRNRRYETANGFAADVKRYLSGEAVQAHPPSVAYRVRKFVRRNKAQVVAASLIVLALVVGIAGTTWQALRAEHARNEEAEQRKLAEENQSQALASAEAERLANQQAQKRLAQIQKGNEILTSIFTDLDIRQVKDGPAPLEAVLARRLVQAGEQLEGDTIGDPLAVAGLQNRLGLSLMSLGFASDAIPLFSRARATRSARLGPDHPDAVAVMANLAGSYRATGRLHEALPLYEEALRLLKEKSGHGDPEALAALNNLAVAYLDAGRPDRALPLLEEAVTHKTARLGQDHPDTLQGMHNLASAYDNAGLPERAIPLARKTLDLRKARLGIDHPDTLQSMSTLAGVLHATGRLEQAQSLYGETLRLQKSKLGTEHPHTIASMGNLAECYRLAGQLDRAMPIFEEALRLHTAKFGPNHPDTLLSMNNLALAYQDAGKYVQALPLYEEALKQQKARLGMDHPDTLKTMANLASCYRETNRLEDSISLYEETLRLRKVRLGAEHADTLACMNNLATAYWQARLPERAIPLLEQLLPIREKKLGRTHPTTQNVLANLGVSYSDAGRLNDSMPLLEEAHRSSRDVPDLRWVGPALLETYTRAGQRERILTLVPELLSAARKHLPGESPQLAGELAQLALPLLQVQEFARAEPILRECLAIREKSQPDDWTTFNTYSLLGGALLGRARSEKDAAARASLLADADPLLRKGYEGMIAREKSIPKQAIIRVPEALDRLVELYGLTEKPDEAAKYREIRGRYPPEKKSEPGK